MREWPDCMVMNRLQMSQEKQLRFFSTLVCVSGLQVCQAHSTGFKAFCFCQTSTLLPAVTAEPVNVVEKCFSKSGWHKSLSVFILKYNPVVTMDGDINQVELGFALLDHCVARNSWHKSQCTQDIRLWPLLYRDDAIAQQQCSILFVYAEGPGL